MASEGKRVVKSRGKVLNFTLGISIEGLLAFIKNNRDWRLTYLKALGRLARKKLGKGFLSQKGRPNRLMYKGLYKNKRGTYKIRNTVTSKVNGITFTSPPLNFFENGRVYKGVNGGKDRKERPRKILTVQFKGVLNSNLQRWSDFVAKDTIEKAIAKI